MSGGNLRTNQRHRRLGWSLFSYPTRYLTSAVVIVAKITVVINERFSSSEMTAITKPAARGSRVSCCWVAKA